MAKAKCKSKYKLPCTKKFDGKTYHLVAENADYRKHGHAVEEQRLKGKAVRGTSFLRPDKRRKDTDGYVYGVYVRE